MKILLQKHPRLSLTADVLLMQINLPHKTVPNIFSSGIKKKNKKLTIFYSYRVQERRWRAADPSNHVKALQINKLEKLSKERATIQWDDYELHKRDLQPWVSEPPASNPAKCFNVLKSLCPQESTQQLRLLRTTGCWRQWDLHAWSKLSMCSRALLNRAGLLNSRIPLLL